MLTVRIGQGTTITATSSWYAAGQSLQAIVQMERGWVQYRVSSIWTREIGQEVHQVWA
jgi:hypothetical protein